MRAADLATRARPPGQPDELPTCAGWQSTAWSRGPRRQARQARPGVAPSGAGRSSRSISPTSKARRQGRLGRLPAARGRVGARGGGRRVRRRPARPKTFRTVTGRPSGSPSGARAGRRPWTRVTRWLDPHPWRDPERSTYLYSRCSSLSRRPAAPGDGSRTDARPPAASDRSRGRDRARDQRPAAARKHFLAVLEQRARSFRGGPVPPYAAVPVVEGPPTRGTPPRSSGWTPRPGSTWRPVRSAGPTRSGRSGPREQGDRSLAVPAPDMVGPRQAARPPTSRDRVRPSSRASAPDLEDLVRIGP